MRGHKVTRCNAGARVDQMTLKDLRNQVEDSSSIATLGPPCPLRAAA